MLITSPSKIKKNKILKGRTISFETANKTHGNMVLIATDSRAAYVDCIKGTLFRPMQLMSLYAPRRIKPQGRQVTVIDQKEYYAQMRADTGGRIKKGKNLISAYNGSNLVYDIYNDFVIKREALSKIRKLRNLQLSLVSVMEDTIYQASCDPDYSDTYLIFPIDKAYEKPQRIFVSGTDFKVTDPTALFVSSICNNYIGLSKYKNIKMIFFYVPENDVLMAIDIHSPEFFTKQWPNVQQKLKRMAGLVNGEETLETLKDEIESEEEAYAELSPEEKVENKKEEIKQVALSKVAKDIHANNLTDYEAASRDERDLMVTIDDKIDKYLEKPENLKKTVKDMVSDLEKDNDIKSKSVRYVETKRAAATRATTLAKGLEKQVEVTSNLTDEGDDDDRTITGKKYNIGVPDMDDRIKTSHLASMDKEYKEKQFKKDIVNAVSSFSNSSVSPLTVDNITFEDASNYQNEVSTMKVRYKTDDGKPLSFQLDVPKIVNDRFMYLGGNKYVIKKQLLRLPITKVKPDTVEITTSFNKMTITRVGTNISRKNAYLLKLIGTDNKLPGVEVSYGDSRAVNGKLGYHNDFEYEELAGKIRIIETPTYYILFNRDHMAQELEILNIPDDFVKDTMTPLGFVKSGETYTSVLYIEDEKIYSYKIAEKETREVSDTLFDFLGNEVLHVNLNSLPTIGKSFVYTQVKFLKTSYPMVVLCGSQVGLTNLMKRYNIKYYFSAKSERKADYVCVKFKDKYLNYEGLIQNTLLLNGLSLMNTHNYNYLDFDADIPYTHYFMRTLGDSIGIHTRNTVRFNLEVMVDPITVEVLRDLKQPTNIIDMMLYANTLLVGNTYKPLNDLTNYRIRGSEEIAACAYKLIADSYVSYQQHKINGNPINLTIGKNSLRSNLITQPNVSPKSTLNPVHEVEEIAQASAKGKSGVNIDSAFTLEMRTYDDSMLGFISGNDTPFSGSAGITRSLAYDPKISSIRGYVPKVDKNTLSATNILAPAELLSSYTSAQADAPRQA